MTASFPVAARYPKTENCSPPTKEAVLHTVVSGYPHYMFGRGSMAIAPRVNIHNAGTVGGLKGGGWLLMYCLP